MLNMGVGKDPGFGVGKMVKDAIHSAIEGNLQRVWLLLLDLVFVLYQNDGLTP